MSDLTPEKLAELQRLLDETKGRLSSPRRAGKTYAMDRLRYAAVNALPALLAAAELLTTVRDQVTRGALCPMCSTGAIRWTVGLVCQLCGTDYSRPEYASMRRDSEETSRAVLADALAVRAEWDALAAKLDVAEAALVRPMTRPVLDVTAGTRAMWFDKTDQRTLFGDARTESITVTDRTRGHQDGTRTLNIAPDVQLDFRALPFPDESFRLVVFDPPHLTRAGAKSWLAARYGVLGLDWRDDLKRGFSECFRVLMPGGVLIFKWSEVHVPLREVLALTGARPLFGHASGKRSGTHWVSFLKDEVES